MFYYFQTRYNLIGSKFVSNSFTKQINSTNKTVKPPDSKDLFLSAKKWL